MDTRSTARMKLGKRGAGKGNEERGGVQSWEEVAFPRISEVLTAGYVESASMRGV